MRAVSRQSHSHKCHAANACVFSTNNTAIVIERPPFSETFCGKLSLANFISLYVLHIARLSTFVFLQHPSCCLRYGTQNCAACTLCELSCCLLDRCGCE